MTTDAALPPTERPTTLGPYRLDGLLGRGGMGEVHRAFDTRRGRAVALKVLRSDLADDDSFRVRFRREADSAARLQDPHVVPIHDFGEIDGRLFIDMRLIDGVGLDRILADGPLDPRRAVALVAQAAEALTDAHAHGVVHRDVKPSNLIVTQSDFVYLTDFGIAHAADDERTALTGTGQAIGTVAYMAPERFDSGPVDGRSDTYSLACTLAECLTGRRPFDATSLPALVKAHLTADPPRPSRERRDVPPELDAVIARGMAKNPADRYQRSDDLAAAARYAMHPSGPATGAPSTGPHPTTAFAPSAARSRTTLLTLVTCAVLLAAVSGVSGYVLGRTSGAEGASPAGTVPASTAGPLSTPSSTASASPRTFVAPAPPVTVGSSRGTSRPAKYVYTVTANYPVSILYVDAKGDQTTLSSASTPWSMTVDTASWGADARPSLSAWSPSSKGDTKVSCSIADDQGREVAHQDRAMAFATTMCFVFQ